MKVMASSPPPAEDLKYVACGPKAFELQMIVTLPTINIKSGAVAADRVIALPAKDRGPFAGGSDKHRIMGAGGHGLSNFDKAKVHRVGIADRQEKACPLAECWADCPKDAGRYGALILRRRCRFVDFIRWRQNSGLSGQRPISSAPDQFSARSVQCPISSVPRLRFQSCAGGRCDRGSCRSG